MKADVKPYMKTHERMESTAADDERYGDISSARVDDDRIRLTSFGDEKFTKRSSAAEKGIGDALVDEGAEAPKPCLSPVEMRMLIPAAGGLLPTDSAFAQLRTIFHSQSLPWSFCEKTKKKRQ